jgi:hypothetical protein
MGEGTRVPRRRFVALGIALVLVAGSAVWAATGLVERDDAASQLTHDRAMLRLWQAAATDASNRVGAEQAAATELVSQLGDASSTAQTIAELDERELALVEEALAAFPGANVGAYNRAANARNELHAQHDTTVEALRTKVDALIAALATLDRAPVATSS